MERNMLEREVDSLQIEKNLKLISKKIVKFYKLVSSYPGYIQYGFAPFKVDKLDLYKNIGGQFGKNAIKPNKLEVEKSFSNSCTIRMSFALNKAGFKIPKLNKAIAITYLSSTNENYIIRVKDLVKYLNSIYIKPHLSYKQSGSTTLKSTEKEAIFKNSIGIIAFIIDYENASGHFTLWNGQEIAGGTEEKLVYFEKAKEIYLWIVD